MNQISFDELTYARFAALVKKRFEVQVDADSRIELELAEVKQFQPSMRSNSQGTALKSECFSLTFHGPLTRFLEQKMYDFRHDELGAFSLFVVAIGKTEEAFQYEVVFNRMA